MQHALKRTSLRRGEYVSIRDRGSDEIRTFRVGRDGGPPGGHALDLDQSATEQTSN